MKQNPHVSLFILTPVLGVGIFLLAGCASQAAHLNLSPRLAGMTTPSLPDETLVKDGAANLQRGVETVGGRLYLTNRRLVFESHAFNVQTGTTVISLSSVTGERKCWTKFLGGVPLFPNSVAVFTQDGQEYRFVTFGRQAWIDAIEHQRL